MSKGTKSIRIPTPDIAGWWNDLSQGFQNPIAIRWTIGVLCQFKRQGNLIPNWHYNFGRSFNDTLCSIRNGDQLLQDLRRRFLTITTSYSKDNQDRNGSTVRQTHICTWTIVRSIISGNRIQKLKKSDIWTRSHIFVSFRQNYLTLRLFSLGWTSLFGRGRFESIWVPSHVEGLKGN